MSGGQDNFQSPNGTTIFSPKQEKGEKSLLPLPTGPLPLPGYIRYLGEYGYYYKSTFINQNNKVCHDIVYLGKLINKEELIFSSKGRGFFHFSIENGYKPANVVETPQVFGPGVFVDDGKILVFGDIFIFDEILDRSGLKEALKDFLSTDADRNTFFSTVAFKLLNHGEPSTSALSWYENSYARVLYPNAVMDDRRLSEFKSRLGQWNVCNDFFRRYLNYLTNNTSDRYECPILIDSTGLPNDIDIELTSVNNHNGIISNEIRLIYIVDQNTGMPIYFRYISGNVIDVSTLYNTLRELEIFNIDIKFLILDAGYYSESNLANLFSLNIPFLVRMVPNRVLYKKLVSEHSFDLLKTKNLCFYGDRQLFIKKISVFVCNNDAFAYLIHDEETAYLERKKNINLLRDDKDINYDDYDDKMKFHGKFVLLCSKDINVNEIVPLYYTRQKIEGVFDICKNNADLLPLRVQTDERIRGQLLLSFFASVIYILTSLKLKNSKYSAKKAFKCLQYLFLKAFPNNNYIIIEPTKQHNDIIKYLELEYPFLIKFPNPKSYNVFTNSVKSKKGRPKGAKGKQKKYTILAPDTLQSKATTTFSEQQPQTQPADNDKVETSSNTHPVSKRPRGRPPKTTYVAPSSNTHPASKRPRGRPAGKTTCVAPSSNTQTTTKRPRGRPAGKATAK